MYQEAITAASRVFRIMDETEEVPAQLNDPEAKITRAKN